MSVQAMSWVLEHACLVDEQGQVRDIPPKWVAPLMGLANHADHEGRGSYPGQRTLARYARKSDRAIRDDLRDMETAGLIARGDQRLVEHIPADERPVVWDLPLHLRRPPAGDRNPASGPNRTGTGSRVPAPADQEISRSPEGAEADFRPEAQCRPVPDFRGTSGAPEAECRSKPGERTGSTVPAGSTLPPGTGSVLPPNRPGNRRRSSSSSTEPEPHARAVAIIRTATDADDDEAAQLAQDLERRYRPRAGLLGAYCRRMATSGDLELALAELRAARAAAAAPATTRVESCPQHPGQPRHHCGGCRADQLAGDAPTLLELDQRAPVVPLATRRRTPAPDPPTRHQRAGVDTGRHAATG